MFSSGFLSLQGTRRFWDPRTGLGNRDGTYGHGSLTQTVNPLFGNPPRRPDTSSHLMGSTHVDSDLKLRTSDDSLREGVHHRHTGTGSQNRRDLNKGVDSLVIMTGTGQ